MGWMVDGQERRDGVAASRGGGRPIHPIHPIPSAAKTGMMEADTVPVLSLLLPSLGIFLSVPPTHQPSPGLINPLLSSSLSLPDHPNIFIFSPNSCRYCR